MDHTIKLWDIERGKTRQTIRHHGDSVKHGTWKPYSNMFLTCSADKKVAVWDARNGVCLHTFTQNSSVNHITVSKQGNLFATCNAAGAVVIYDIRKMAVLKEVTMNGASKKVHPMNFCLLHAHFI
jgi:WD40 repeat protein